MLPEKLSTAEQILKKMCTEYFTGLITKEELIRFAGALSEDAGEIPPELTRLPEYWQDAAYGIFWTAPFLSDTPEQLHFHSFDRTESAGQDAHTILMQPHQRYSPAFLHSHDYYEIVYLACGSCLNIFPDDILELHADEILFLPPGQAHAISAFQDDAMVYNFLVRTEALSSALPDLLLPEHALSHFLTKKPHGSAGSFALHAAGDPGLSIRVRRLWKDYQALPAELRAPFLAAGFRQLLILLLHHCGDRFQILRLHSPEASGNQLLKCIREECATITLGELAWRFGYNYEHISRMIKKQTGSGFAGLRRSYRMEKAAELLQKEDLPIETIMTQCGYESRSSFFQNFKSVWQTTPARFRLSAVKKLPQNAPHS